MNLNHIGLYLSMEVLEIPIAPASYQEICDALFLASQRGLDFIQANIYFNHRTGHAHSPRTHESGGDPSRNALWECIQEVSEDIDTVKRNARGYRLVPAQARILRDIREIGIVELMDGYARGRQLGVQEAR